MSKLIWFEINIKWLQKYVHVLNMYESNKNPV